MCHLILFLPAFALPIFWVFPLSIALPLYLFIMAISLFLYFKVFQAMHQGVQTGQEAMLKKEALVIEDINPEGKILYAGEIWNATGKGKIFLKGEQVLIREFRGLRIIVDEAAIELSKTSEGNK
jgi:membrane protein implicated in regulation of membrane protease activity